MKTAHVTPEDMKSWTAQHADYAATARSSTLNDASATLWGAHLAPLMGPRNTQGRFAGARLPSPTRACTGHMAMAAGATSMPYRNPDAIENLLCLEGSVEIRLGPDLDQSLTLNRFDMLSIPVDVLHTLRNASSGATQLICVLNAPADSRYPAAFSETPAGAPLAPDVLAALAVSFGGRGRALKTGEIDSRITRFKTLVPYKRALTSGSAIPPAATEWLTAGSVYPLIVPEGHVGRSQSAPLKGLPGLYLAIAECVPGDGPLPHAHFDSQESFFVLDGEWDITWGFEDENRIPARTYDLVAMPDRVMRSFRNTGQSTGRLFVIIQGQEKMSDLVAYAPSVGDEVVKRYGADVADAFRKVNITFDAERV